MEIYQGCQLVFDKTWLVQTPRIGFVQFTRRELKTIEHVSKYHGIQWTHPGKPFNIIFNQVRAALRNVNKIIMHGHLKSRIFRNTFKLNDSQTNHSSINVTSITLYDTLPDHIDLDNTMFHLRKFYYKSNNLPLPPFRSNECVQLHKHCTVSECILSNAERKTIETEPPLSSPEEDVLMIELNPEAAWFQELLQ